MTITSADRRPRRARKRGRSKAPTLDPVTEYARLVLTRRIITGRAVKLACERHLRDLKRERTAAFPFYFDLVAAQHILDFFALFLTLESGAAFVLSGWQIFCWGSVFGWKQTGGARRFQEAYVETAKGSGKSPALAATGLYGLAFDDAESAEIYSAAFDQEQASIILRDAIRMASDSRDLQEILDIGKYNIAHLPSRSFFRAVSSEHRSKSGPRPHFVLCDELHEHRDGTVINKMRAGFKGDRQPLLFKITNSGFDRTSVCWHHHQKSLQVLEGTITDEQWFAYVCQLDPCDKCYDDGYRQPKDGCPRCDDWTDPKVWPKVNPSLVDVGIPGVEYLRSQVNTARSLVTEQALIKRLNFCIWTETHQVWISADRWDACHVDAVHEANPELLTCAAGLDPSSVLDLTAFVVALRIDDPPDQKKRAEQVEIQGMDEHGQQIRLVYRLDFHVELIPYFWLPQDTLNARVQEERIPYDVWARTPSPEHPYLFTTPGPAIDHNAIYDFIIKDALPRFKIQRLGMDENSGRFLFMKLRDEGRLGERIVSVGQGKKLSEAFKFIEILIAHRRLRHNGNPVLGWCFANAEPKRDRIGALWIEKPSETKRIDGAQASAMAIKELMALPARRRSRGAFVV